MTTTPEPPAAHDDEAGAADNRFDQRIAFAVIGALAVVAAVGPFGWHMLSSNFGSSANSAVAALGGGANGSGNGTGIDNGTGGGAGSNGAAAVTSPATSTTPSAGSTSSKGRTAAQSASASCTAALDTNPVGTTNGTSPSIGSWADMATPSINALRTNAATLRGIVTHQDASAVPAAAKSLCDNVGSAGQLAAMPDAVGAAAWQAALSAYVAGAADALAATSSHPAYYQAAEAQLVQGDEELDALAARITATTQR
jgi:hypothetical protein